MKRYLLAAACGQKKGRLAAVARIILFLLSAVYSIILTIRKSAYDAGIFPRFSAPAKIIGVGNITVGGTGKTPLVELLVEYLSRRNQRVAVISRGYGAGFAGQKFVADEPDMLKREFPAVPVIIDKNRVRAIKKAVSGFNCGCIVLDDAFQNLRVKKDLDIVCIDALNPFGNNHVLPRGIMRVPLAYLANADICVLTHAPEAADGIKNAERVFRKFNRHALIVRGGHVPEYFYELFSGKKKDTGYCSRRPAGLLCGIACPEYFERTAARLGADVRQRFFFADHHLYRKKELNAVMDSCRAAGIEMLITTAKDEPRLKAVLDTDTVSLEILVLKITLKIIDDEKGFLERVSSVCAA